MRICCHRNKIDGFMIFLVLNTFFARNSDVSVFSSDYLVMDCVTRRQLSGTEYMSTSVYVTLIP